MKILFYIAIGALIFTGCSKKAEDIDKPADFYYQKMVSDIAKGKLDNADSAYTSLSSVHPHSPLIKDALLILADAHMNADEFSSSKLYYDEYLKRYGDKRNMEYVKYLKVKADFMGFKLPRRDQQAVIDAIKRCDDFLKEYPNSQYTLIVETMKAKLDVALKLFNLNIAQTYTRVGKPDAAKLYLERANSSWVNGKVLYEAPTVNWWRDLFEIEWIFNPYPNPNESYPAGGGNENLETVTQERFLMDSE